MPDATPHAGHIFISHGKADSWLAAQISSQIRACGPTSFLDESDIDTGDDFKKRIHVEIARCTELVVLFTPWSSQRFWVWVEVGAAWGQGKRVVAVLYGLSVEDLEALGGSKAILDDINVITLNEIDGYFVELRRRYGGA